MSHLYIGKKVEIFSSRNNDTDGNGRCTLGRPLTDFTTNGASVDRDLREMLKPDITRKQFPVRPDDNKD
jgi:hypothetical protein